MVEGYGLVDQFINGKLLYWSGVLVVNTKCLKINTSASKKRKRRKTESTTIVKGTQKGNIIFRRTDPMREKSSR